MYPFVSSPSSLAGRSATVTPPFSPGGHRDTFISPRSPLGSSISRHEHYIKPVPPFYVTEYEDRYRDPREIDKDVYKRGMSHSYMKSAKKMCLNPHRPSLLGSKWRSPKEMKDEATEISSGEFKILAMEHHL